MVVVHRHKTDKMELDEYELRESHDLHESIDEDRANLLGKPTSSRKHRLLSWDELPNWLHDNIFITSGYRHPQGSYTGCLKSLFYLHNESVNIWSHLFGFFLFLAFGIHFIWTQPFADSMKTLDYVYFFSFIVGAMVCLGCSSAFHCFSCHSEPVASQWNRCDYAGIVTLTVGSFFPLLYYGFHCQPVLQIIYIITISVLGIITTAVALLKHFRTPAYRWMRTSLFLALGLFGVVPIVHGIIIYGLRTSFDTISLGYVLVMAVSYVGGALIYGYRIPERWSPGKFNIWGASHQIFHFCVVIATISHYIGVMRAMRFWHAQQENPLCLEYS